MIGTRLSGRYEIIDRVGGGGMAIVYKAKDILLNRVVAVKILRPQYAIDEDFVNRFRREAQAAASLSHPNIVSIYDVGVEGETHYIVMEYVEGSTLKEYISGQAPLPVQEAILITKQIAEALEHAHHNNIIHRDIKPHNILISSNSRIKVTDFGIARAVTSATITHTGSVIGSVHYFSPEQARGGMTGEKSDIYSLGIVLYEMLTGVLPFSGESPISIALKHLQENYKEPRELNPAIPQSVENIILRSLEKDPLQRYDSARELIDDVETCLSRTRQSEEKYERLEATHDYNDTQIDEDDEATKVMPIIRDQELGQASVTPKENQRRKKRDEEKMATEKERSLRWVSLLIKVMLTLTFFAALAYGGYQAYLYAMDIIKPPEIVVEDVSNLPVEEAVAILREQGLRVDDSRTAHHDEVPEGHVISQHPLGGAIVTEGNYVRLTVSLGRETSRMPVLINRMEQTALRMLEQAGFLSANIEIVEEESEEIQAGYIIRQEPEENEMVVPDETKVILYVSTGQPTFDMPNLIGLTLVQAEAEINRHNLELDEVFYDVSDLPEGQVYRQLPVDPGQEVEAGTPVQLWVSTGLRETFIELEESLFVTMVEGEQAIITIFVTDVDRNDRLIVQERIAQSKQYSVSVKVDRGQPALIKLFKNGVLQEQRAVAYVEPAEEPGEPEEEAEEPGET